MKKLYYLIFALSQITTFAQSTLEPTLHDIGKTGSGELKNLKLSNNQLFFSGKEFFKLNLGKYDFETQKFITYNNEKENYALSSENYNYVILNQKAYFTNRTEDEAIELIKGNDDGSLEIIFTIPKSDVSFYTNNISNLYQFDDSSFYFISTEHKSQNLSIYTLFVSDGTNNGTKKIIELESSLNNIKIITKLNDLLYFTYFGKSYTYNTENEEINEYDFIIPSPNFVYENKIYFFKDNYSETPQDLFVLNDDFTTEKIASLENSDDRIGDQMNYYALNDKIYFYTNSDEFVNKNANLFVLDLNNKTFKKIFDQPIKQVFNVFEYSDEFYFSIYDDNLEIKNYKISDLILNPIDYHTDYIYNTIVYDDKLFFSDSENIYHYNFETKVTEQLANNTPFVGLINIFHSPFIYNDNLYFVSWDNFNDTELFTYNKQNNTKEVVFNYNSTGGSHPMGFQKVKDKVLFFANDNILHEFNPKNGSTEFVLDQNQELIKGVFPDMIYNFGNEKIVFSTTNFEMGFSNGTPEGTFVYNKRVNDDNFLSFYTSNAVKLNDKLIFIGSILNNDNPWVTDGTLTGTFMLKEIVEDYEKTSLNGFSENGLLNNKFYFTANSSVNNFSSLSTLYETDGTIEGTKKVYEGNIGESFNIIGKFKNYLILEKKNDSNSYKSTYHIFDPITQENIFVIYSYPLINFFEFENKIYFTENNSLYYLNDQYNRVLVDNDISANLKLVGIIDNTAYLLPYHIGQLYTLKNNKLEPFFDFYLHENEPRKDEHNIYFINYKEVDNYFQLSVINNQGLTNYKLNFNGIDGQGITEYVIIDKTMYMSKHNGLYGQELYTVELSDVYLNNQDVSQEINVKSKFTIYPNPVTNHFYIKSNSNEELVVTIFDTNGRKISQTTSKPNEKISTIGLSKGIYFVHIDNGLNKENKKIIVQ